MNRLDQAQVLLSKKVLATFGEEISALQSEGFSGREAVGIVLSAHLAACSTALHRTGLTLEAARDALILAIQTVRSVPQGKA
jgi:hypothetical protein